MRDSTSAHSDCCEARPINILRVASASSSSGYVLYSGITTDTIMAPASTDTQPSDEVRVSMESRATQTENGHQVKSSSQKPLNVTESSRITPRVKPHSCLPGTKEGKLASNDRKKAKMFQSNDDIYDKFQRVSVNRKETNLPRARKEVLNNVKTSRCPSKTKPAVSGLVIEENDSNEYIHNKDNTFSVKTEERDREDRKSLGEKDGPENVESEKVSVVESKDNYTVETIHPGLDNSSKEIKEKSASNCSEEFQACHETQETDTKTEPNPQSSNLISAKSTALPLVSWVEGPPSSRKEIPVSVYSSMFEAFQRPTPLVLSHTPRILVTPKHTCPEGLTSADIILGVCINPENTQRDDDPTLEEDPKNQGERFHRDLKSDPHSNLNVRRVKSAVVTSHAKTNDDSQMKKRPVTGHHVQLTRPRTSPGTSTVNLELSILSLNPNKNNQNEQPNHLEKSKVTVHTCERNASVSSKLDTMNAIRRSYQRIQSAPPLSSGRESVKQNSGASPLHGDRGEEVKTFSSPYWRAKSAYHRRILNARESEAFETHTDGLGNTREVAEETNPQQGTLLRPLLYTSEGSFMRHSAGCPYKCKNCFRACLVSDDFAQKAKHNYDRVNPDTHGSRKDLDPYKSKTSFSNGRDEKFYRNNIKRRVDAIAIVQRALARSQPLFQRVYGAKGHPQAIRPWPSYAWMDIKQRKSDTDKDRKSSVDAIQLE